MWVIKMAYRTVRDRVNRITILKNDKTKNVFGHYVDNWTELKTIWASKEHLIGREYFAAQQAQSGVTTKFETEYYPDIQRDMRVKCDGKLYDIEAVNDLQGLKRDLLIYCKEVVL